MAKRIDNTPDSTVWTITLNVSDRWIADGFGHTKKSVEVAIRQALYALLPYALPGELGVEVKHPSRAELDRACERFDAQGTEED